MSRKVQGPLSRLSWIAKVLAGVEFEEDDAIGLRGVGAHATHTPGTATLRTTTGYAIEPSG